MKLITAKEVWLEPNLGFFNVNICNFINICILQVALFSLKFVGIFLFLFAMVLWTSITLSQITAELSIILANRFPQLHVAGLQKYSFSHTRLLSNLHQHLMLFHHWSKLPFPPSSLHLHSYDKWFVNVFDSFISVIMLNTHCTKGFCVRKRLFPWFFYSFFYWTEFDTCWI